MANEEIQNASEGEQPPLQALAGLYGTQVDEYLRGEGFVSLSTLNAVNESWNVSTKITNNNGEKVATLLVGFSKEKFYLSYIGIEEKFRKRKISSKLYEWIGQFLAKEKPGYQFSLSAVNDATKHLARKYFRIVSERGSKMRGFVK